MRARKLRSCSITGCDEPIYIKKRGWCQIHYDRWRRHGDPTVLLRPRRVIGHCSVLDCEQPVFARQWCRTHYKRWFRYGDPLVIKKAYRLPTACSAEGCNSAPIARGLCMNHYALHRRWGTPERRKIFTGIYIKDGYRYVMVGHRHYEPEHRLVMERLLGRKLNAQEHVHHLDGDTLNNSPSNLEILSRSEHLKRHLPGRRRGARGHYIA